MGAQSQISATVSVAIKEKLDRFTESHGLKKNFVVEQALIYFMEARRERGGRRQANRWIRHRGCFVAGTGQRSERTSASPRAASRNGDCPGPPSNLV